MQVAGQDVSISNPDKIFFPEPGLTKGDLVQYYVDLADAALPHLRRRLFHMVRYPNGVEGKFFHQKRHRFLAGKIPARYAPVTARSRRTRRRDRARTRSE